MISKSEQRAAIRLANAQLLEGHGMTVSGGMWGEAGWIVLPDGRVASICNAFMGLEDHEDGCITLYVYSPPFQEGWTVHEGEAPFSDQDEMTPCVHYHLDSWHEALGELDRLMAGLEPVEKPTPGMDLSLTGQLTKAGGLTPDLLKRIWVRVKDRDPKVTQIDTANVADLGQGAELWFGIVTRRDQFAPFVTWANEDTLEGLRRWQVVRRDLACDDMGEAMSHLTALLTEIAGGVRQEKASLLHGEAGFLLGILDEIGDGKKPGAAGEVGFGS